MGVAEKAIDQIAKACGCEKWDYPDQVVRHVERMLLSRAELLTNIDDWKCASGLIGSSGDPADIEPEHMETDLREREREAGELREGLREALAGHRRAFGHEVASCHECGFGVLIDEDGCCTTCGRDAFAEPASFVVLRPERLDRLRALSDLES